MMIPDSTKTRLLNPEPSSLEDIEVPQLSNQETEEIFRLNAESQALQTELQALQRRQPDQHAMAQWFSTLNDFERRVSIHLQEVVQATAHKTDALSKQCLSKATLLHRQSKALIFNAKRVKAEPYFRCLLVCLVIVAVLGFCLPPTIMRLNGDG